MSRSKSPKQVRKSSTTTVLKKWGYEWWLINIDEYCSKLLYLNPNTMSSLHYHEQKKETFICLVGNVALELGKRVIILTPESAPVTIKPLQHHRFKCVDQPAIVLEISTHHNDNDVVRLEESRCVQS